MNKGQYEMSWEPPLKEIESLRKQLESYERTLAGDEVLITGLRNELAECQKERNKWKYEFNPYYEKFTAAQARIAELVEALKQYVNVCSSEYDHDNWNIRVKDEGHYAREALSRTDNLDALNEYVNQVLARELEAVATWSTDGIHRYIQQLTDDQFCKKCVRGQCVGDKDGVCCDNLTAL